MKHPGKPRRNSSKMNEGKRAIIWQTATQMLFKRLRYHAGHLRNSGSPQNRFYPISLKRTSDALDQCLASEVWLFAVEL